MNTLSDLRSTLEEHAHRVTDGEAVVRTAAVRHRVAVVRRRRRAVAAGGLSLALVLAGGAALVNRGHSDALPTAPTVLGVKAPTTFHSLGYTYRTDGSAESGTRRVSVEVQQSERPQLFSWTADQATEVTVHVPGDEVWDSVKLHFRDFVVVPPGGSGRLSVAASEGRVGVARYTLTEAAAPGYTRNGVTYRQSVAGRELLGAAVAAVGSTGATTDVRLPRGRVQLAPLCTGVPAGYDVLVTVNGERVVSGDCSDPNAFDPGGAGGYVQRFGSEGSTARVRVVLTHGGRSTAPVTDDLPHLKLGIGVYDESGAYGPDLRVTGMTVDNAVEHGGHTWVIDRSITRPRGPIHLPPSATDHVAAMVWGAGGTVKATFAVDGEPPQVGEFGNGPGTRGGAMGGLWVRADRSVRADLARGKGPVAVVLYTRAD